MKAVIMAGGWGKRLRPITCTMPKPMVPLLNKPVIGYCLELLKKHGVTDVTATLHYLPNEIMQHCGGGERYGVKLDYAVEDKPLGTAGSVRQACKSERVLVISGDAMTDIDITAALRSHEKNGAKVTIVLKKVDAPTEYGVALMHDDGRIYRFLEKPMLSEVFSDLANTGIYILEPDVVDMIPQNTKYDFSCDLFPLLLKNNVPIYGYVTAGYWCDIGDITQYKAAQRDMLDGRCKFDTAASERDGVWIEKGAHISDAAELTGPCYIGAGAEIGEGAAVGDHSVIGSGARLGAHSSAKRTVVMENARVRENVQLRGAILGPQSEVDSGASIYDGSVVGSGARVGKNCTVSGGASLWPDKRISDEEKCTENVKWDDNKQRPLSSGRICEYADTCITPERMARVGAAYAACIGKLPGEVAVATDGSQQGVMLKHALISGIVSQGVDVADMGFCGYSAFEYGIREFSCTGGVYIRCDAGEHHKSEIIMCDVTGSELTGERFRSFSQELAAGAHLPVTSQRLGIVQRVSGASRAYEAYLTRMTHAVRGTDNGVSILIGGNPEIYDMTARVLQPCGYRVRYYTGLDMAALYGTMVHEKADAAFMADYENGVTEAIAGEERLGADRLSVILALAALEQGRGKRLVMPADMAGEYIKLLIESGAEVAIASSRRAQRMREALESGAYLPELFEPEARIIRTAELVQTGKLMEYVKRLPKVELAEKHVGCSWRDVGRVLRSLVDTEKYENVELVDGVKVRVDDGWILVRPDSGFTACRIIAGSFDAEYSKELADVYHKRIKSIAEENK